MFERIKRWLTVSDDPQVQPEEPFRANPAHTYPTGEEVHDVGSDETHGEDPDGAEAEGFGDKDSDDAVDDEDEESPSADE